MLTSPDTTDTIEANSDSNEQQPIISQKEIERIKAEHALYLERICRDAQGNVRPPTFCCKNEEAHYYHAIDMMAKSHLRIDDED